MPNSLNILQVNPCDQAGGAEKVAWELHHAYRTRGYGSWLAVGCKRSDDPDIRLFPHAPAAGNPWSRGWWRLYERLLEDTHGRRPWWQISRLLCALAQPGIVLDRYRGLETYRFPGAWRLLDLPPRRPDILHLHNLHGNYFDLRALPSLCRQAPVVLTLHDTWLFSGHCAYTFDCERWRAGCGHCPDLTIYPAIRRDATAENWQLKQEIFAQSRLFVTAPSRWVMELAQQSMLAPAIIDARVIPNGIDLSVYCPGDRAAARAALNIDPAARVLLFAANGIRANKFKDYRTLRAAVEQVAANMPVLCIALGEEAPSEHIGKTEIRFVPFQRHPAQVARYYQAADLYIHTARADNFPTAILEAMACGLPVVATAVGGIPEQVEDGVTGLLAPSGDAGALARSALRLLRDGELRRQMAERATLIARQRFDLEQMVDAYLDWYAEVMARWSISG